MKKIFLSFLLAIFFAPQSYAKVTIFACESEWQSLAKEIVKDKAQIALGTFGSEDPRNPHSRFGMKKLIKKSDLVFCNGGHLEDAWLPKLVKKSYDSHSHPDGNKYFFAKEYLDGFESFDHKRMRAHNPLSNNIKASPRIHLSPYNIKLIAKEFTRRVKLADPINDHFYQEHFEEFTQRLDKAIIAWEKLAKPLVGMRVVVTDDSWHEIADWLGLEIVAKIDPARKGFISQNRNLNKIRRKLKRNSADAIIFAEYEDSESIDWLASKSFTRQIMLPITVNSSDHSSDLFEMFSTIINALLDDCAHSYCHHEQLARM